jgi:hypothetical protein
MRRFLSKLAAVSLRKEVQVAPKPRARHDTEREAQLSVIKELTRNRPAPHAAASLWTGVVVLVAWPVLFFILDWLDGVLFPMARYDLRLAEATWQVWGQVLAIPWFASAFGLVKGILGLMQPHGKKGMAVGGCILNGLLCVGPLAAVLALSR